MSWLSRNAESIEAIGAAVTALVAVAALIGVKYQLDAADRVQKAQSARQAYSSHLALGVAHPELAQPSNVCGLLDGPKAGSYVSFIDHLLYSAEQMLEVEPGWEVTFAEALEPHSSYICRADSHNGSSIRMEEFLDQFKADICQSVTVCN